MIQIDPLKHNLITLFITAEKIGYYIVDFALRFATPQSAMYFSEKWSPDGDYSYIEHEHPMIRFVLEEFGYDTD